MTGRRRAFTLIEMVLVLGALAAMLGLCAGMIHLLLKLDRAQRAHLAETTTLGRLAPRFRQDVRAATSQASMRDESGLVLSRPGGPNVEYRARPGALVRTRRDGDRATSRDTYALPRFDTPQFQVEGSPGAAFVALVLRRKEGPSVRGPSPSPRAWRVEALLGKDQRFASPRGQTP
jgi:hypothetical protein